MLTILTHASSIASNVVHTFTLAHTHTHRHVTMSVASSSHSHTGTDASAVGAVANSTHGPRLRLGSVGDSVPASDSSEGTASETFEHAPHWAIRMDDHPPQQQHQRHPQHQPHQPRQSYRLSGHLGSIHGGGGDGDDDEDDALHSGHSDAVRTANANASAADDDEDEGVASEVGLDSLSLENSGVLSELERGQVESFFSGLGTEVSTAHSSAVDRCRSFVDGPKRVTANGDLEL